MSALRVAYPAYWGNLEPALQHTAYADEILANEFEPLVKEGAGGSIVPGLAHSWAIREDYREFVFHLKEDVRFSDGTPLTAEMVKRSWEEGLRLQPRSANSSLQDVLYLVDGYDDYRERGHLRGVQVEGTHTVRVLFKRSFRTALAEFATGRMSVFLRRGPRALGTGPYVIHAVEDRRLELTRNPHYPNNNGFREATIVALPQEAAMSAIANDQIDLYAFADGNSLGGCHSPNSAVGCHYGHESYHVVAQLNGLRGRFFEDVKHRQALQYLVHTELKRRLGASRLFASATWDPQSYLPLQAGRLHDLHAERLIERGAEFVESFLAASRKSPIYVVTSSSSNELIELLRGLGVALQTASGEVESGRRLEMYYRTYEPDIVVMGMSVSNGDPDGLFHALASDGAIASPMIVRPKVDRLLQEGRSIMDPQLIGPHYSRVSEAVLEEVPLIHLGFGRDVFLFNYRRVAPLEVVPGREIRSLLSFAPRE